jgi:hypothetical protein
MASEIADIGGAVGFAAESLNTLTNEIGNGGVFDPNIRDPQKLLEYERSKIESDYQGLRGLVNSVYSGIGLADSFQAKTDLLDGADRYSAAGDAKSLRDLAAQQESAALQQLRAQLDTAAASETKTEFERQRDSINQEYAAQRQAADEVQNGRTFQSQGFKSQAEANAFAQHLRDVAGTIRTAEDNKLELAREGELASGQGRLDVLKQAGAGDMTGAARTALENELDSEQLRVDPNDKERLKQFNAIREMSLANFDADAGRQDKFQAAESNERILAMNEEAKDAELRGAGKTDEARIDSLRFQTQQRIRMLQDQADATGDSKTKSQLQQEIAAATEAGKRERDALQMELQRTKGQTGMGENGSAGAAGSHLAEVSKKLDDAATKLERAISGLKNLSVLKD